MLPLTDSQAEAGKALAETTGKALDLTKGIGSYLAETIGTIPQDLLGLAGGDWLHEKRQRNLAQMRAKTARILEGIGRERISEPSPSVILPLLEASKDEGREELQELWAALLAAALVDGGRSVRRSLFTLAASLEPIDAAVLRAIAEMPEMPPLYIEDRTDEFRQMLEVQRHKLQATPVQWQMSMDALMRLDCITTNRPGGVPGLGLVGRALIEATSIRQAPAPSPDTC